MESVVKQKIGCPVDELIREIFYFLNIKVSDKIYQLLETLTEIVHLHEGIPHPLNKDTFFQYSYFLIMIVTEINSTAVQAKPTLPQVVTRISHFAKELEAFPDYSKGMFERISAFPFSQDSRGVLSYYNHVKSI